MSTKEQQIKRNRARHQELNAHAHMNPRVQLAKFNPHLSRIYLNQLEELPDNVKNYPVKAQKAWAIAFNLNLKRYGDYNFAFKAAWRALQNKVAHMKQLARERGISFDQLILSTGGKAA